MFYSCFYSTLCRALWSSTLRQFSTSVQTHNSPIISILCPRKEIWWQQLFTLQLSTFNNVSGGLTRPSVSPLVSLPPGTVATPRANTKSVTWSHPGRVKIQTSHLDVAALSVKTYTWCPNTNDEAIWTVKQSIHSKKNSVSLVLVQILWSNLFHSKNICSAFDFANMLIGHPSLPLQFSPHILKLRFHNFVAL